jgi:hypothetical protein
MRSAFLLAVIAALLGAAASAQKSQLEASGYVEVLGNADYFSANVDATAPSGTGLRVGVMADFSAVLEALRDDRRRTGASWEEREESSETFALVVMGHRLHGDGRVQVEMGAGVVVGRRDPGGLGAPTGEHRSFLNPTATLGFRITDPNGLVLRAGWTPQLRGTGAGLLRAGLSVGWRFSEP